MTAVLHYARYLSPDSHEVYECVDFCGSCRMALAGSPGSPYSYPYSPEDLDRPRLSTWPPSERLRYFSFCPWCGTRLDDEWWHGPLQNERPVDHYRSPGTHQGDEHLFPGDPSGHLIDACCPCGPQVVPALLGCEVRHNALQV